MIKIASSFVLAMATALALTACGGGGKSSGQAAAESQLSAIQSAESQAAASASLASSAASAAASSSDDESSSDETSSEASSSDPSDSAGASDSADSSAPGGASSNPASFDVCSLLSPADASAVAQADKLDPDQTASTVYTLTATKTTVDAGASACEFDIKDNDSGDWAATFEVSAGSYISKFAGGTPIPGLGDEAYHTDELGTGVRVGGLLLIEAGLDEFTTTVTQDMFRKMAPKLK